MLGYCIQFGLTVFLSSISWWNWVLMSLFNLMKWIDTFKSNFEFLKIMFQFILCFNLSFVANNHHQKINKYKQKHQETISINKHWYKYSLYAERITLRDSIPSVKLKGLEARAALEIFSIICDTSSSLLVRKLNLHSCRVEEMNDTYFFHLPPISTIWWKGHV